MEVSALAVALMDSRRQDGAISAHELERWLSSAGLEELARTVSRLPYRVRAAARKASDEPGHAWI